MGKIGYDFDFGTQIPIDPNYVTLVKTSATSIRLGIALPFKDQEIYDEVQTRTYFDGRILYNFNTEDDGTSGVDTLDFVVNLAAMDVIQSETEGDEFEWATLDMSLAGDNSTLVHQTLQECIDNPMTFYDTYNSFEDDSDIPDAPINAHQGDLKELENWHETNNYNSLVLLHRLSGVGADEDMCKFYMNLYDISLVHYISFDKALDDPLYANIYGRVNNPEDIIESGEMTFFKYTGDFYNGGLSPVIEKPTDVLYHLLEKEFLLEGIMDNNKLLNARDRCCVQKLAFSVDENIKSKRLIAEISSNSNIFPIFRANSEFTLNYIAKTYNDSDVVETIKEKDIISYNITRSPIQDIHTAVNVRYKIDYQSKEFTEETGYIDGYDMYGNKDSYLRNNLEGYSYNYLGLEKEDKVLEFEAKYIRDEVSAVNLRDFLFAYNCNQHNEINLKLPVKYLHLEIGDVINFDKLIEGVLAYGEKYTVPTTRNGQEIYPYFIVSSISKKMNHISVEVTQLHNLTPNFQAHVGSITRARGIKNDIEEPLYISEEDISELNLFLLGAKKYFTRNQKRVSDLNSNGYITSTDLFELTDMYADVNLLGDANADGFVNVVDIVEIVTAILDTPEAQQEFMSQYNVDLTGDGVLNVFDLVAMVNQILEGDV